MNISNLRNKFHSDINKQLNYKIYRIVANRLSDELWHQVFVCISLQNLFNVRSETNEYFEFKK